MRKSDGQEKQDRDKGKERRPEYVLDELLKGVTEGNLQGEIMTDPPVGKEIW